jgi:hypothetical protein
MPSHRNLLRPLIEPVGGVSNWVADIKETDQTNIGKSAA